MVQKLENIKGGGGSIRVGTTGTISALMTRELESIKTSSQASTTVVPLSSPKTLQQGKKSLDEASSSSNNRNKNISSPQTPQKVKSFPNGSHRVPTPRSENVALDRTPQKVRSFPKGSHRVPMLRSENVALDRTPSRERANKKGTNIVEIVDIKCGHPDKPWASPITSKLRKLGFSKLSESTL